MVVDIFNWEEFHFPDQATLPQRKYRVGDEGNKLNQELVDLDFRSTFEVVTSK